MPLSEICASMIIEICRSAWVPQIQWERFCAEVSHSRHRESYRITVFTLYYYLKGFRHQLTKYFIIRKPCEFAFQHPCLVDLMQLAGRAHMLFSAPSAFDQAKPGSRENQT